MKVAHPLERFEKECRLIAFLEQAADDLVEAGHVSQSLFYLEQAQTALQRCLKEGRREKERRIEERVKHAPTSWNAYPQWVESTSREDNRIEEALSTWFLAGNSLAEKIKRLSANGLDNAATSDFVKIIREVEADRTASLEAHRKWRTGQLTNG